MTRNERLIGNRRVEKEEAFISLYRCKGCWSLLRLAATGECLRRIAEPEELLFNDEAAVLWTEAP